MVDTKYTSLEDREEEHRSKGEKCAAWVKPWKPSSEWWMRPIDTAATPELAVCKEAAHTGRALAREPGYARTGTR